MYIKRTLLLVPMVSIIEWFHCIHAHTCSSIPVTLLYSQDLKLKYHQLMIELCHHEKKYVSICQHYRSVFETPKVSENPSSWKEVHDDYT